MVGGGVVVGGGLVGDGGCVVVGGTGRGRIISTSGSDGPPRCGILG